MPCWPIFSWIFPTNVTVKDYVMNINISNSSLGKKSTSDAILYALILWIFNIPSKIRFLHIDLKLF